MANIDIMFSRKLLSLGCATLKKHFPHIRPMKDGYVWHFIRDDWEFHGPDDFYWWGSSSNAYEARYKGWSAWLRNKGIDLDKEDAA